MEPSIYSEILNFDVYLDGYVKLNCYENILKSFKEWTSFKREIKLNALLENKKIQFDIEEINKQGAIWGVMASAKSTIPILTDACFVVKSMRFIIKDDNVEKLSLGISPLSTDRGSDLKKMIESNIEIVIRQNFIEDQINSFYIELPKMAS